MKTLNRILFTFLILSGTVSCYDDSKLPYPKFEEGVSYRPLPSPWTSRPRFSAATPNADFVLNISSYNASSIEKVDVFVSYLPNTPVPATLASTLTYSNYLAPVSTAGAISEVPDSGTSPVTINYARYEVLKNGATTTNPPVLFTRLPRFLLTTLSGESAVGELKFNLSQLISLTSAVLPITISTVTANQPAFILIFEVTKKDGNVFTYLNSGPGITANPPTGRVATRTFNPGNKTYNIILSGEEGSPFVPGVSIRVAP
jgi:hypothetical protein